MKIFRSGKDFLKSKRDHIYYHIPSNFFWNKSIRKNYKFLMRSQWWDYKELVELQNAKLARLLNFVYKYVPYYQRVFNELKIMPVDIRSLNDFKVLPIIDKTYVNENFNDFVPQYNFKKSNLFPANTSGSSGQSLHFQWHANYYYLKCAANYRNYKWAGQSWSDKIFMIMTPIFSEAPDDLYEINYKTKTLKFDTARLDDQHLARIIMAINKIRPEIISGYPSLIYKVSKYISLTNIKLSKFPKAILTVGEILFDEMRKTIEEVFQTKIYDWYGMTEGCASAGQCESGNYHINMEYCHIEFVEKNGIKNIVGTNLENIAFPFIRYNTGDVGDFLGHNCSCRRGLPLMKPISGRLVNIIKTPRGDKFFTPNYFSRTLKAPIKEFQIIQESIDSIELYIVKRNDFKQSDLNKIMEHLSNYLGKNIKLNIHLVNNIKREPLGKYQMVISEL